MAKTIVGCGGVSRSGKNSFCDLLQKKLEIAGLTVKQFALADQLKADLYFLVKNQLNIDVYKCTGKEKLLVRPLMVDWGMIRRIQTNGQFWTGLVEDQINKCQSDVCLVSDIRYDFYTQDEGWWIQEHMKGVLVHISRYDSKIWIGDAPAIREFIQPPNKEEAENDPKIKARADWRIEWPTLPDLNGLEKYVDEFLLAKLPHLVPCHSL